MRLSTINHWLRKIGLVLIVATGDAGEPTTFRLMRWKRYLLEQAVL